MPIQFDCACGRRLRVPDEWAGKRARCPACGVPQQVPVEEIECDVEVVEEVVCEVEVIEEKPPPRPKKQPAVEEVEFDVEIIEDEPPRPKKRPAARVVEEPPEEEERPTRRKRKRRRRPSRREDGPLSQMYMEQARDQMRRDEARARIAGGWEQDEDGGRTMFGIHVTAGVLSGTGLLFTGLLAMLFIAVFRDPEVGVSPKLFIGAIVCAVIGIATLVRSIFFGEED